MDEPLSTWPPLDVVLARLGGTPSRIGSVISTIYGDAILPRGGKLALADLLALMRALGANDGMVRTAVSRLAREGTLQGHRIGRASAYALTAAARAQFLSATPRIYSAPPTHWNGNLYIAFPEPGADRAELETAGYSLLAPGVLLGFQPAPGTVVTLTSKPTPDTARLLAARAWPLAPEAARYKVFIEMFSALSGLTPPTPSTAMATRIATIHAYRRAALKDPRLPPGLLPTDWPGTHALNLCRSIYRATAPLSESWLDTTSAGSGPLPKGPDPTARFV